MIVAAVPGSPAHVVRFTAAQHSAAWVISPPAIAPNARGVEVIITSSHDLPRGPVRYEGGYRQQRLAATVFLYNTKSDFFGAGLALRAGGGTGCVRRHAEDVCRTIIPTGFVRYREHRWKKLRITLRKPSRAAASVRIRLRSVPTS